MSKRVAGFGRKRPQLNIPIELLDLDTTNPRLANEGKGNTQFDLVSLLYNDFDLEELAYSMAENGYFDEEPIVVIPVKFPPGITLSDDIEKQQKELQTIVDKKQIRFIVVEGNRRTATVKILTDDSLKKRLDVGSDFPKPLKKAEEDLKIIPAIYYPDRTDISAYLGVRHIAGLLKWEAYAKAVFLASRIEAGIKRNKTVEQSITEVQRQTADRSDVIRKQYQCYLVLKEAEAELSFDISHIKDRFSLITVALTSANIREFIGIKSYRETDFSKRLVPVKKLSNLEKLLLWVYGNNKEKQPILTDSRKITARLAPVLGDADATEYLIKYGLLEEAYERSGGEKMFLLKKLNDAVKNLRTGLTIAYKYKTKDVKQAIEEVLDAGEELKKMVK